MPAKRFPSSGDPALKTRAWEAIKQYWRTQRVPDCQAPRCLLPGIPIRYTGRRGPDSLDVGHIHYRDADHRTQWQVADTRPEHARCNRSAGGRYARAKGTPGRSKRARATFTDPNW